MRTKLHFFSRHRVSFCWLCVLKGAQCEQQLHGFLHMFLQCVLSLVCTLRSHRSVLNLPPRLSKQARADWQAPARWRHPFIGALTPVSLAPLGRSPWRRQTRELRTARRSIHLRGARSPENKPAPELCRSFITLKQRDEITAQRTCRANAVSRLTAEQQRRGGASLCCYRILTQNNCCIPSNRPLSLLSVPVVTIKALLKTFFFF